jgi:hypothetical protein
VLKLPQKTPKTSWVFFEELKRGKKLLKTSLKILGLLYRIEKLAKNWHKTS